jgi:hypothetical protein
MVVEHGHEGTVLWASWFVGGAPAEDEDNGKAPQVGRFMLDSDLWRAVQRDAALLRSKQKRKHIDVGYLDDGLPTRELALRVVDGTQALLQDLMTVLASYFAQHEALTNLVLLCDRELCTLPVQVCRPLASSFAGVARDFSLAMHMHRQRSKAEVDKARLRYIVDPRSQDAQAAYVGTVKRRDFSSICTAFSAELRSSFGDGVSGDDHVPSKAEWQRHLAGASLFLYQGVGALLCHMAPALLATLNLTDTQCVVLLDRADNEVSERRQNKLDTATLPSLVVLRGLSPPRARFSCTR